MLVAQPQEAPARPATEAPLTFSVVTVVLNDLAGLKATRASIEEQTFPDFEWIVVDGGSADGTAEFLRDDPGPVARWVSESDAGIYDAMNRGVTMSTGSYVLFMNAGDVFADGTSLARVGTHLKALPNPPDVVFGGATLKFPNGRRWYRPPKDMRTYVWHGLPASHQATYYRRERLQEVPYDLSFRVCGDYYLAASLYRFGAQASYLDEPLAEFMVGGTSFRSRRRLLLEPLIVQANILRLGRLTRLTSLLKRLVATAGTAVLYRSNGRRSGPPRNDPG